MVDEYLSDIHVTYVTCPQTPREKMFQIGGLIVFCGLLAQLEAQSSSQDLPSSLIPGALASSPTDLVGNFTNGK